MFGYVMSKINLLIFVTAVFALMLWFLSSIQTNAISEASSQIAQFVITEIDEGIKSESTCSFTQFTIPQYLTAFGVTSNSGGRLYQLKLSSVKIEEGTNAGKNLIVASIYEKKNEPKLFAARSLVTNSNVKIYDEEAAEKINPIEYMLNPRAAPYPIDTISVIKEVYKGQTTIYLIPCSSLQRNCFENIKRIGCAKLIIETEIPGCFNIIDKTTINEIECRSV